MIVSVAFRLALLTVAVFIVAQLAAAAITATTHALVGPIITVLQ
jgi:hypothetical protein